jgi:hypothetical protein
MLCAATSRSPLKLPARRRGVGRIGVSIALFMTFGAIAAGMPPPSDESASDAADDIAVTSSPRYSLQPARVTIRIRHQPSHRDRQMTVEAESAEFFRSSTFALDGAEAGRLHVIVLKALPAGQYRVRVAIHRADAEMAEATGVFAVCDGGSRSDPCALHASDGARARP